MNELTAVVLGASGLTGGLLVGELLKDSDFKTVRVLVRKTLSIIHPKLEQCVVDFDNREDLKQKIGEGDVIFSCIGTTRKKVGGNRELYEKIDCGIPVAVATMAIEHHFRKLLVVSAVGADEDRSNFYLHLKGKTENELKRFPFESISFFRPSVLNGKRKEIRPVEQMVQMVMDVFSFLLLGPFLKYRAIGADNLARAMVYESKQNQKGIHYYYYGDMMDMARELKFQREEEAHNI